MAANVIESRINVMALARDFAGIARRGQSPALATAMGQLARRGQKCGGGVYPHRHPGQADSPDREKGEIWATRESRAAFALYRWR